MSILSAQFLILAVGSSILMWVIPHHKRIYRVLICNIIFLALLGNVNDWLYASALALYTAAAGCILVRYHKKSAFAVSIIVPVLGLCFYKYGGAVFSSQILMPLGISFYTFKAISYLSDLYQGKTSETGLLKVVDYVLFFPTFLAGPINRCEAFFQEIESPFVFQYRDQKNGAVLTAIGVFQKLVISSELQLLSSQFLDQSSGGWYTVIGIVLYSFYIYTDFDAYSNIAIGTARMMGFHLEQNFHCPYLSGSIQEFWQRWHISLSSWLKDYIYIPLGGSRKGTARKYLNILITFLVSGFWHGSTAVFILWGLLHGLLNILEDLFRRQFYLESFAKYLKPLAIIINFILVSCLWVFFRSASLNEAIMTFQSLGSVSLSGLSKINWDTVGLTMNEWIWMFVLLAAVIASDLFRNHHNGIEWLANRNFAVRWGFYILLMLVGMIFGVYGPGYHPADFIYITF